MSRDAIVSAILVGVYRHFDHSWEDWSTHYDPSDVIGPQWVRWDPVVVC